MFVCPQFQHCRQAGRGGGGGLKFHEGGVSLVVDDRYATKVDDQPWSMIRDGGGCRELHPMLLQAVIEAGEGDQAEQVRVDAVEEDLVSELLFGEATHSGWKVRGVEERGRRRRKNDFI